MTQLWRVLRGEVEGGDCGRDTSLTPYQLPASRLLHHACQRVVSGAVVSWPGPPDQSIHTQSACDELLPHPHTYTRNAKQNRNAGAQGNAKKMLYRNAEHKGKIEERGHTGTQRSTGTRAHLCVKIDVCVTLLVLRNWKRGLSSRLCHFEGYQYHYSTAK